MDLIGALVLLGQNNQKVGASCTPDDARPRSPPVRLAEFQERESAKPFRLLMGRKDLTEQVPAFVSRPSPRASRQHTRHKNIHNQHQERHRIVVAVAWVRSAARLTPCGVIQPQVHHERCQTSGHFVRMPVERQRRPLATCHRCSNLRALSALVEPQYPQEQNPLFHARPFGQRWEEVNGIAHCHPLLLSQLWGAQGLEAPESAGIQTMSPLAPPTFFQLPQQ